MHIVVQDPQNDSTLVQMIHWNADWLANQLIPIEFSHRVGQVRIKFVEDMELDGTCTETYNTRKKQFNFEIKLAADLGRISMSTALSHEFIHLKQTALGELGFDNSCNCWTWNGKNYGPDPYSGIYCEERAIERLPWEAEAYGRQKRLMYDFWEFRDSSARSLLTA